MEARIRKANPQDVSAIAKVHVDSWRTTYKGIVADDYLAALSYEKRESAWLEILKSSPHSTSVYVAESPAGAVVGFASSGPEREGDATYRGEIYCIYLLQNYQRRGIGSALWIACVDHLRGLGFTSWLVWVLKSNPACQFYQALGGRLLREKNIQMGNQTLLEAAYGWASF